MSHTIGRSITVNQTIPTGSTVLARRFGPEVRFVILHFTELALAGPEELRIDLGYDIDVFHSDSGQEAWTRPIDPRRGEIHITASRQVVLQEIVIGERTAGTDPSRPNVSHADPFLHTVPYEEPDYETTFRCGPTFDWANVRAASGDPILRDVADAVCCIFIVHRHGTELVPSSCTGTLIAPDLILTAHHCFVEPDGVDVKSASVTFDYETDELGARPDRYSPFFHKVVEVVGRSTPIRGSGEWAILRIRPPEAGLEIAPRELRRTPVMSGERVIAVHHPHGSPKKVQAANTTNPLVPGFDFAGGSSGSAGFDSLGRVIGGPLASGSGCSASYTPATTVLADLDATSPSPGPIDVVLVLDRSGSMSQEAPPVRRTKLREMQSAASMFVTLVREGAGDRLGLVSYSATASIDAPVLGGEVTPAYKAELVGPDKIRRLTAAGSTSIGDGLLKASNALQEARSAGHAQVILLMTDGLHNTPPATESVNLNDVQLGIVGFGHDHALDGARLQSLARAHEGVYTRAVGGLDLKKIFALRFGNIFMSGAALDPPFRLSVNSDAYAEASFEVCGETEITLVVIWQDDRDGLVATLSLPDGATITRYSSEAVVHEGDTWWFMRVKCPEDSNGTWRYRVMRDPTNEFPARTGVVHGTTLVLVEGGPRLTALPPKRRLYTGDTLDLRVALFNADGTAPHGQVAATIDGPASSIGNIATSAVQRGPMVEGDALDGFRTTLQNLLGTATTPTQTRQFEVPMLDDSAQSDGSFERDGIFTALLPDALRFEGNYTVRATARYACGEGHGMRETTWSLYVDPGIDPDTSDVRIDDMQSTPDGHINGVIVIYPRDKFGSPIGPNRPEHVQTTLPPGTRSRGSIVDRGDGSYALPVEWPAAQPPTSVVLTQPERPSIVVPLPQPAVPGPEEPTEEECPTCKAPAQQFLECLGLKCHSVKDVQIKSVSVEFDLEAKRTKQPCKS